MAFQDMMEMRPPFTFEPIVAPYRSCLTAVPNPFFEMFKLVHKVWTHGHLRHVSRCDCLGMIDLLGGRHSHSTNGT